MRCQKGPQIALGDPHDTSKPMRHQIAGLDPPADRASGDIKTLRHIGDHEELDLIAPATAALRGAASRLLIASAMRHYRSPPYSEVERTGLPIFDSAKVSRSAGA
jgi:hypothetical protein